MDTEERAKLSFEYARDATKQLMTLATGFIALTVTFSKDFIGNAPDEFKWVFGLVWFLLFISVFFGQFCLMAMTHALGSKDEPPVYIYSFAIKRTGILQVITF